MMPRLIIIIIGQLRSADSTAKALFSQIAADNRYVVMVQCPENEAAKAKAIYGEALIDAWDPPPKVPFYIRYSWPLFGNSGTAAKSQKASFYFQLMRLKRAGEFFGPHIDIENDIVLKWRPDLRIFSPLDLFRMFSQGVISLPEFDNHGGLNDQCAIGPADLMLAYFNRLNRVRDYFEKGGIPHSETFLKWSLEQTRVERMDIAYCIDRGKCLNPVKFSIELGDNINPNTISILRENGVNVEFPGAPEEFKGERLKKALGMVWQKCLVHLIAPNPTNGNCKVPKLQA